VGAESHSSTIRYKNGVQRQWNGHRLPVTLEGKVRINEKGENLFSPNWEKGLKYKDNEEFINALVEKVCMLPVSKPEFVW
jgi:hypothetical protein